jgi:hypothetical protein
MWYNSILDKAVFGVRSDKVSLEGYLSINPCNQRMTWN